MKNLVKKKIKHLKKYFKFKNDELIEIEKMYKGEFFDPNDIYYQKLLMISKDLCNRYSQLNGELSQKKSPLNFLKYFLKKQKMIDLLFPIHKTLSGVGENIDLVIGCVDFLGCGYANRKVVFSHNTLTVCNKYTIFGTNIKVGNDIVEKNEKGEIKLGKVIIGENTWICAGVKINNNVTIGNQSVIGAGAVVTETMPSNMLCVGRPCKPKKTISDSLIKTFEYNLNDNEKQKIKKHLKSLKCNPNCKEFWNSVEGKLFNTINLDIGKIYILTHNLCYEYNSNSTSKERKKQILDILFLDHGQNFNVGTDLFIDLLGTIKVGNNVTIKDSVYLSGLIKIGDNVTINSNTSMFVSGHELNYNQRKVGFSLKNGLYEFSVPGYIIINDDLTIGENVIIAPNTIVTKSLPNNCLATNSKIIM